MSVSFKAEGLRISSEPRISSMTTGQGTKAVIILILIHLMLSPVSAQTAQNLPIPFIYEDHTTPQLSLLRQSYQFDEYTQQGSTEWQRMVLLKDWVFSQVDFRHNYRVGNLRNALTILQMADEGASFHCSHFAAIYMQCALSLGWTARYYFLRNIEKEEHAVNEIWSNQWRKWVFIDVTWNIQVEKGGIPLSLLEIREEWLRNGGRDLVYVFGAGENEQRYGHSDLPVKRNDNNAWRWWPLDDIFMTYTYEMALITRNDFFSFGDGSGEDIWGRIIVLKDEVNEGDSSWAFRNRESVTDPHDLYYEINRVDIAYKIDSENNCVISLDAFGRNNFSPNFESFLVRIDGGDWKPSEALSTWQLTRRRHVFQARVRNQFGVLGPVTEVNLISN